MTLTYGDFIARKAAQARRTGVTVDRADIHPTLHEWQAELVAWAADVGRAAIWADTGLGKTFMQVEWARAVADPFDGVALIVAPLAVCEQTVREAAKLSVHAVYVRSGDDIKDPGLYVTNYEMASRFDPEQLTAVVLDEASILKQSDGATRTMLIRHFADVPFRLSCTATPAPNDPEELTNQAEFLGHSSRVNMLAAYFVHDDEGWRLKGHARRPMFRWMSTWAVAVRRPSDLGYPDDGYGLPGLEVVPHLLPVNEAPEGQLFATDLGGVGGRAKVRRSTLTARVLRAVELVYDCGSQGVQPGVLRGQQGQVEARSGGEGSAERPSPRQICERRGLPSASEGPIEGRSGAAAATEEGWAVRPESRRRGDDAGPGMPGVRSDPPCRRDGEAAHRPRPLDGHHPRCSMSALQPGVGTPGRRSNEDHGSVSVPHACRDQWVIWCGLNDEQAALKAALGDDCRSIDGRTPLEDRVTINQAWVRGEFRVLIVKPGMYSFGMNWQHCARMAFVGLSDSYETYYQSIRRCYRYGQARVVHAHVVLSELEAQVAANVARKERDAASVVAELVTEMQTARKETRA